MLQLFAQAAGKNNDPFNAAAGGSMALIIGLACGFLLIAIVIQVFFLLNISKCLSRCRPRNRTIEPGQVWLMFIPLFNIVWQFILVNRVAETLEKEYRSRGWSKSGGDYGKTVGMAFCILTLTTWIPFLGSVLAIVYLVCYIIYWVKIAGYSKELASEKDDEDWKDEDEEEEAEEEEEDDDEDERPRKKRR
jgi:hypothetical protein